MDVVTFDGQSYVKATLLAKRYRYSTDYLGQLARAKKIDARVVGRAWYINEDTLLEHKRGKYKTHSDEISSKKASNNYVSRVAVEPYLKTKTARLVLGVDGNKNNTQISYQEDSASLMPKVAKTSQTAKRLAVAIADAETVKITSESKKATSFAPEPLPEVFLKGALEIKDITEDDQVETLPEPKDHAVPTPSTDRPVMLPKKTLRVRPPLPPRNVVQPRVLPSSVPPRPPVVRSVPTPASFTPQYVAHAVPDHNRRGSFVFPVLALCAGLLCGVVFLATTSDLLVTATETVPVWSVSIENLLQLFE